MFVRIEVAMKPEHADPLAQAFLRKVELARPDYRKLIRWARYLEVFWLDLDVPREKLVAAIGEIFQDRVLSWLFTGNLIPSAAGEHGNVQDLMQEAPDRPGVFCGLEKRYRAGVTDPVARTTLEAFQIVLGQKDPNFRAASGALVLLEGPKLNEDVLAALARDVFCNELIESWTAVTEEELRKSGRFHPDQVKRQLPRIPLPLTRAPFEEVKLAGLSVSDLESLSKKRLWALNAKEMQAIQKQFLQSDWVEARKKAGLPEQPTDVEMEMLAQTWSEHCKHKIFNADVSYREEVSPGRFAGAKDREIPSQIHSLFKETISGTTAQLERPWLLSVFKDNAGIVAFDDEDAVCIKVETHNSPSALDPYGGALTGVVGVNRDILGAGRGARPLFNTDVFCVAHPHRSGPIPDRLFPPRRILEGVRRGVEHGGNKSGIPTVNGALVFDDRYLGKPLVYCGTGGILPRSVLGTPSQEKNIQPGDRICMVGGRIGKDGVHGATFSSLALDESSPVSAVQLGDPLTQKRVTDFLMEARDLGLYRTLTDNGAGGLSSSVGELATLSGGARLNVAQAKTKYPGLKAFELLVSESQERMTCAVPTEKLSLFFALAERRGVEVSDLGEFTSSGNFEVNYGPTPVASLPLSFLHGGVPTLELQAVWKGAPAAPLTERRDLSTQVATILLELLGRPNIASKEWMIRQYDHEVQGTSVVKPLHTVHAGTPSAQSGPNDAAVIKPKAQSFAGLAVGCGINPRWSDVDAYLMAQSVVDEAVRNVLAVGAEYGSAEHVFTLVDNFCWPDPVSAPERAGDLVRACYGMQQACLELGVPLVSGKDSMKNDFRGTQGGQPVTISVPPTLLMTAMARVTDVKLARTADLKAPGDAIYVLGNRQWGLWGSELHLHLSEQGKTVVPTTLGSGRPARLGLPDWATARRTYSWLGGAVGKKQVALRSAHDLSDGGLLVALAESLMARKLGAIVSLPESEEGWEFLFGEGFHSLLVSVSEIDVMATEAEWKDLGVPFLRLGSVTAAPDIELRWKSEHGAQTTKISVTQCLNAWKKEGYWE